MKQVTMTLKKVEIDSLPGCVRLINPAGEEFAMGHIEAILNSVKECGFTLDADSVALAEQISRK